LHKKEQKSSQTSGFLFAGLVGTSKFPTSGSQQDVCIIAQGVNLINELRKHEVPEAGTEM